MSPTPPALPAPCELEQLLLKCHRDELLPLARVLKLDADALGFADLAKQSARTLRRLGSHGVSNVIFRRGEGRPYPEVVAWLAHQQNLAPAEPEVTELAMLRASFQAQWGKLSSEARAVIWKRMGLGGEIPVDGPAALATAEQGLGRTLGYQLSTTLNRAPGALGWGVGILLMANPMGCLLRPFFLPLFLWWGLQPSLDVTRAAVVEVARIRQVVRHRLTIGVVGSPSTGKDAAIRTLFGIDTGNISPIAGSTKEVAIQRLGGSTAFFIVNTPGMGDVVERVTEEARQILDHIDIYLYLINAEGGVQARELADYQRCKATGKPLLAVVNKIDVLRPRDKDRYLADARAKLGAPEADFIAAAFDPLPELSPAPINVDQVHAWLARAVAALGKDPAELPPVGGWGHDRSP